MNWSNTVLTEQLGIRYPILQAPMAGGPGTPQLVAAVSNAGGLGSLAGGYLQPEALRQAITEVRALTDRPFAVNLAVSAPAKVDPAQIARAHELLAPYRAELGLPPEPPALPDPPEFEAQLDIVLEEGVAALSFIFGVPDLVYLELLREAGIVTLGTATHLLEAIVLEESGVDFIIAQGAEAGGHRGTFIGHPEQGLVGILTLVPLLAKHIAVPVVAAGGIMDGRGISAARVLGAAGVQMGTAFLTCPESGAHPAYKALLREGSEIATTLSRVFTGRFGRVLRNRLSDGLRSHEAELPGFPAQLFLTQELRQAAAERNRTDFMALWAGQGCHLCEDRSAAELIATWVGQATALLGDEEAVATVEAIASVLAANDSDLADSDLTDSVQ
jgi:nitronate monooxygenase